MSDQAPAADPALDALDRLLARTPVSMSTEAPDEFFHEDAATIRTALADRITPAEARMALGRGDAVPRHEFEALIARLGKIADAGR
jgi:hypothetical protein